LIRLQRWGGRPPRDDELLEIDPDGTFRMRRTVGPTTRPATPVGRFGGVLPAASRKVLADLAARLEGASAERNPLPMDASMDELTVDGAAGTAAGPAGIAFSGAWGELAQVLRGMLVDLAAHPVAAIVLARSDGGLLLEHRGSEELDLVVTELVVSFGSTAAPARVPGDAITGGSSGSAFQAGPGWAVRLPIALPAAPATLIRVEGLLVGDGTLWRPAVLELERPG
jgi:hypothetical protein